MSFMNPFTGLTELIEHGQFLASQTMPRRGSTATSSRTSVGFTIVELLIVIVVIGILAAIVIVAFNGIQDRARDTSVQTDLRNFGKTVEIYKAMNGSYPSTAQLIAQNGVKINKDMYLVGGNNNWYYCISTDGSRFAVGATAKSSRQGFRYDSVDGLQSVSSLYGASTCPGAGADGTAADPYFGAGAPSGCQWSGTTCNWQGWIAG